MFHALLADSSLSNTEAGFLAAYFGIFAIVGIVTIAFSIFLNWRIVSKAGYNGGLSLLVFIPFVNFIAIIMFAFTEWPIERRLREAGLGALPSGGGFYVPPGGGGYAPTPSPVQNPYANQWGTSVSAPTAVPPPPSHPYLPDPPTPPALPPDSI